MMRKEKKKRGRRRSNEKEEIASGCITGVHSTEGYKLGETVQTYKQIGDTNYWYREL